MPFPPPRDATCAGGSSGPKEPVTIAGPALAERWWKAPEIDATVNGTFKGGGAKGLLYAGALLELRDAGYWFRGVAGSSAGAITATLIAAGLKPEEMISAAPEGLRSIRKVLLGDLVGSTIFRADRVGAWLQGILGEQLRRAGHDPGPIVSFQELYDATGIELFVVSVDVADRQPRIFSAFTTPALSVADAVIASSAIPMAFRPGRVRVAAPETKPVIHRLIDGGVWANYPAFIFRDPSFRAYHRLEPLPANSTTIGFTLDGAKAAPGAEPIRFIRGTKRLSRDKGGLLPTIFRNPVARLYLMTALPLIVVAQMWYTLSAVGLVFLSDFAVQDWVPPWLGNIAAFIYGFHNSSFGLMVFGPLLLGVTLLAMFLAVFGATLIDSGLPAMRTLLSVGTDVPYWVGAHRDDHVVRLLVPQGLTTTTFRLPPSVISEVVTNARAQAAPQIAKIMGTPHSDPTLAGVS